MDSDHFLTILTSSEGMYKDKGSKFLAFAYPVSSIDEVKGIVSDMRKKYFDARHVCYAYVLDADRNIYRANDDGEPSSTAGKPILGQINSLGLTNILVVVVRYFGGILLGTSGLIVAYRSAAADALTNATFLEQEVTLPIQISFSYEQTNVAMRIVNEHLLKISHREFTDVGSLLTLQVLRSRVESIKGLFKKNNITVINQN